MPLKLREEQLLISRNKFSQTQLVLLSFKVTTCFDLSESSSGHYLRHMQVYQVAVYIIGIPKCITKIRGNNISEIPVQQYYSSIKIVSLFA